jgi:hypothetical protein
LVATPARLKRRHACDQLHSSRAFTLSLSYQLALYILSKHKWCRSEQHHSFTINHKLCHPPGDATTRKAAGANSTSYGANITLDPAHGGVCCTIFSGPRVLGGANPNPNPNLTRAGGATQFLFDMMFTPAHPLDLRAHWKARYLQIGYGGVGYGTLLSIATSYMHNSVCVCGGGGGLAR